MTDPYIERIGVFGDIHGEHITLERGIEFFAAEGIETLCAVGDIVDGHGDVEACCQLLQEAGVIAVRGNHERWHLAGEMNHLPLKTGRLSDGAESFLASLPSTFRFRSPHGDLLLGHGVGADDLAMLRPDTETYALQQILTLRDACLDPDLSFILGGHTHDRMVRALVGITAINAGTLMRGDDPCLLCLDLKNLRAEFLDAEDPSRTLESVPIPLPPPPDILAGAF